MLDQATTNPSLKFKLVLFPKTSVIFSPFFLGDPVDDDVNDVNDVQKSGGIFLEVGPSPNCF